MQSDDLVFVRKNQNVSRNYERLSALRELVDVPCIYQYDGTTMDMEYIHGIDMRTYLLNHPINDLNDFLIRTLKKFASVGTASDYSQIYAEMLSWMKEDIFPFTREQLISKLPKVLPRSTYHGDMTLENIIYSNSNKFYLIDAVTLRYDSWVFDIAKLRQDLECKWFLRHDKSMLDVKLLNIQENILQEFPIANNDYLLILMLLRVYLHCERGSLEHNFIIKEINRLWK